jgi:hypothetical protein
VSFLCQKANDVLADLAVRPGDENPHGLVLAGWRFMVFLLAVWTPPVYPLGGLSGQQIVLRDATRTTGQRMRVVFLRFGV